MSTSVPASHQLSLVYHIPNRDLDEEQVCMISMRSYQELNSDEQIIKLICNGVPRYLDATFFFNYLDSPGNDSFRCFQCRAVVDITEISKEQLKYALQRKKELEAKLDKINQQYLALESSATKIKEFIDALSFLVDQVNPIEEEIAQLELRIAKIERREKEKEIDETLAEELQTGFDNPYSMSQVLQDELFTIELREVTAKDALKWLESQHKRAHDKLKIAEKYASCSSLNLLKQNYPLLGLSTAALAAIVAIPALTLPAIAGTTYLASKHEPARELFNRYMNNLL